MDTKKIEKGVRLILEGIGEDPERPGLKDTPTRVADMYAEIFSGIDADTEKFIVPMAGESHDEMVMIRDIAFYSVCEHHLLPFFGKAHIAYIPGAGKIVGISALAKALEGLCQASPGAGEAHRPVRRLDREPPEAQGCHGRDRCRAPLHEHAGREEARFPRRDLRGTGDLPSKESTRMEMLELLRRQE